MILDRLDDPMARNLAEVLSSDFTPETLKQAQCFKVTPNAYRFRPDEYLRAAQISALVKKLADIGNDDFASQRLSSTITMFLDREKENYFWNTHFFTVKDENSFIRSVLTHARYFIRTVLNESYVLPKYPDFNLGSGVTSSLRGKENNLYHKMNERSLCSHALACWLNLEKSNDPFWASYFDLDDFEIEDYCDIDFVPKTVWIDRVVTFDPFVNKTIQRSIGEYLRDKLDSSIYAKINLRDRPEYHKALMRGASLHSNKLCTIDVENASNSIYDSLVFDLLPSDIYRILNKARIKKGFMPDGSVHHFEMFSANGNGFTFELETLIFLSLVEGVKKTRGLDSFSSVFGDDIIVSDNIFNDVVYTLENLGLRVNIDKTYGPSSYFRESCGSDYFYGKNVRPKYFKDFGTGVLSLYRLHNAIRAVGDVLAIDVSAVCEFVANRLPLSLRFYGPEYLGDGVLHSDCMHYVAYKTIEQGRVHVHKWTRAIRQIVDDTEKLQVNDLALRYSAIWRIMYHQISGINPFIWDSHSATYFSHQEFVDNITNKTESIQSITGLRAATGKSRVVYTVVP